MRESFFHSRSCLRLPSNSHEDIRYSKDCVSHIARSFRIFGDAVGVKNAPTTFQRMMSAVFKKEQDTFVLVYLDDILVFSHTVEEHISHLRTALRKLRDAKLFAETPQMFVFPKREWSISVLTYRETGYNQALKKFAWW